MFDEEGEDRPHEPDEPDPEADLPDYEADLTSVPEAPAPPDPTESLGDVDVPDYVREYFWRTLLAVDYAVAAVCIGPMLVYFEGDVQLGAAVTATGLLAFAWAYYLYRAFRSAGEEAAADDAGD